MIELGPLGEGTACEIAQAWLIYLDSAKLEWWRSAKTLGFVKEHRELINQGKPPRTIFLDILEQGLRRVAKRVPYVSWGAGPWYERPVNRRAGFWPDRRMLARDVSKGSIVMVHAAWALNNSLATPRHPAHKHWLVIGEDWYALQAMSKKRYWTMVGEAWYIRKTSATRGTHA